MDLISASPNDVIREVIPNNAIRECMEIFPVIQDPDTPFQTLFQHAV